MSQRHRDEIDRAVLMARRAATVGCLQQPDQLTKFLYQRWFLGRMPATGPAGSLPPRQAARRERPQPWRSWSPRWEDGRAPRGADLVRLHLSCAPHTTLHALAAVTAHAQQWRQPWLLTSRAVNHPAPKPDSTVLFLPVEELPDLQGDLQELVAEIEPFLAATVPALTLRVGRGATLAQNPPDGRSYGEHRCRLIAEAVLATVHGSPRDSVLRTLTALAEAGIDPRRPYRAVDASWEWSAGRVAA